MRSGDCTAVGAGGGTEAGRGIIGTAGFGAVCATGGGGGTEPRRGPMGSVSGAFTIGVEGGGGGTEPRRGIVGGSGMLSGATIFSVIEGNGRRDESTAG